ncbi:MULTISPECIES: hydroxymethylglutaryl-CoA lyase [Actinopolyspora]|uniref:Hydroxymethylglutaryl-CoA lyase n=1 Tax=Actinopolyspora saharensis TaxID=995062 RepID=A0A1H1ED44_9ACTN|nr:MULTISPECIES: hydroxymethylglutaryl-CoA lyase [Actinopolyspora]NHD19042.1 hydroxymethylglutaryl-CoA lyase [Actinopolyspora sp. BKK2]NHE78173.1 hydroxymethylglutaryl-CoA lyase [Actinopolyspora sp. BKK1]SDQ86675.1 hydroxymethylglutaryl-CoA lyase [Actinopolyspora saharensis]
MGVREIGLPEVTRSPESPELPEKVTIWEVGPRDGLQNESEVVPTAVKLEFVNRLNAAGLPVVETTSFVHPKWVPQLSDAAEVLDGLARKPGVRYPALVPNERGLERALSAGVEDVAVFASATESFAERNLNSSFDQQFAAFRPVVRKALEAGVRVRGYLSMVFGDPWEGQVSAERVVSAGRRLLEMGCDQISLGDTIGVATPGQVEAVLRAFRAADVPIGRIGVHFHDTYGQALANTYAALRMGVSTVDSSAGGLGGCPYAGSATGNLATEDLVWMLQGLGIEHGVDLKMLVDTSTWMGEQLGKPSPSPVVKALAR